MKDSFLMLFKLSDGIFIIQKYYMNVGINAIILTKKYIYNLHFEQHDVKIIPKEYEMID